MTVKPLRRAARLTAVVLALCLSACASLPDVRNLQAQSATAATPTVEVGAGDLSARAARSMLLRRMRGTKTDPVKLAAMEEAATGSPLIGGNRTTLLFDGPQAMGAMLAAMKGAQDNINLETYIFDQDELGQQFQKLLIEKQMAGVQVNIMYDSIGSLGTPAAFFDEMRAAGIKLIEFNPINPLKRIGSWTLNNRDHRKILVVDGRIGFTGGVNISENYARSSLFRSGSRAGGEPGWRDTHIQIEGPAVASLQLLFLDGWASQKEGEIADREYFPPLPDVGDKLVRVLGSLPDSQAPIYKAYVLAIQEARQSIHLTAAYFAPDVQFLEAITAAARRGVDVKIIFPSISDAGMVKQAGQSFYADLLESGVRIFELKASVLHAKTGVIDHTWSTIGSANLDVRSFLHNREANLVILGSEFGATMEGAFAEDLKNSVEMTPEVWNSRSPIQRMKEWAARNFEYWL